MVERNTIKENEMVKNNLCLALLESLDDKEINEAKFYQNWFSKKQCYYFLFKKNLSITNISHAELLGLLRSYVTNSSDKSQLKNIQFVSSREFKSSIKKLLDSFKIRPNYKNEDITNITELYKDIISNTVVVDSFFGSCIVSLPNHLNLDIQMVCSKSGYIHSCGNAIYRRNIAKANKDSFFYELRSYLSELIIQNNKKFLAVYAHEDFTDYDREKKSELRNGLDEVKIYIEKYYLGDDRLVSVINEMKEQFKNTLVIPNAGNSHVTHNPNSRGKDTIRENTIWIIIDKSINKDNLRHTGEKVYFMCYDQLYINQNQFHIFDENKPAWVAHTTIPHTLAGAMISITKPFWPDQGTVTIGDPFCGSGTIGIEVSKFSNTIFIGGDHNKMGKQMLADNINFLFDTDKIKIFLGLFEKINNLKFSEPNDIKKEIIDKYLMPLNLAGKYYNNDKNDIENKVNINELSKLSPAERLVFYINLRTIRRHEATFERNSVSPDEIWFNSFISESLELERQFKELINLYNMDFVGINEDNRTEIGIGTYSKSCIINRKFEEIIKEVLNYNNIDARKLNKNTYDVIITDPPYGINTSESPEKLAKLYKDALESIISSLKTGGQLVICLPERTRTGQTVPHFTNQDVIIQQVLQIAYSLNREVVSVASSVPKPNILYRPPYYWDSERSLRRMILHFTFKDKK